MQITISTLGKELLSALIVEELNSRGGVSALQVSGNTEGTVVVTVVLGSEIIKELSPKQLRDI
jgi:hypothetical protein